MSNVKQDMWRAIRLAGETGRVETVDIDGVQYQLTAERIEPEQPRWWYYGYDGEWKVDDMVIAPGTAGVYAGDRVRVFGTTADRDAKRDKLLEAAREAGRS